ncbi:MULTISPECIES: type II secretion system major pseudopilin GspG [unclassified Agrobacterium]|uniref:type II secretion system major pseudopilin GspG n=1 Tax=unclassified Agrobacterium TaxID=2632611 RepID=UPI0003698B7C|nr:MULTISPECIES: type II secretion system major pseudopilin GspG [unclassified Agrobacterium]SNB52985.1 general secretion pathway protein G [Agrobacterium sp. 719_389]
MTTLGAAANQTRDDAEHEAGFTMVELLVVLAIIGLVAAIAAPQVLGYLGSARVDTAKVQMRNLQSALELLYIDIGRYPSADEGLDALVTPPESYTAWNGPYIKQSSALVDPWGAPYQYKAPAGSASPTVGSFGRDGKAGGEGLDADIAL